MADLASFIIEHQPNDGKYIYSFNLGLGLKDRAGFLKSKGLIRRVGDDLYFVKNGKYTLSQVLDYYTGKISKLVQDIHYKDPEQDISSSAYWDI